MKTNYEKLMKINYEKLLIFYLPFTPPSVFIGEVVRWEIPEAALRLHRVNIVLPL